MSVISLRRHQVSTLTYIQKSYTVKAKVRDAKEFWSQPITTRYLTAELAPSAKIKRLPSRSFFDEAGNLAGMIDTFVLPEQRYI
jgi:hypothetical protein